MRKAKDEERLSTLRSTLEQAFERFKVCISPRDTMHMLSTY
jgi:hypothetical protein